jgi:hypothetical protein
MRSVILLFYSEMPREVHPHSVTVNAISSHPVPKALRAVLL